MRFSPGTFGVHPRSLLSDTTLSAAEKLVWIALSDYANEDNRCRPGTARLAIDTSQCQWTVRKAIKLLVRHGWLQVTVRRGITSNYRLIVPVGGASSQGTVSMQSCLHSAVSHTALDSRKRSNQEASDPGCGVTHQGGAVSHTDELYPLNYKEINREGMEVLEEAETDQQAQSPRRELQEQEPRVAVTTASPKQGRRKSPEFLASYDSVSGHFTICSAARAMLQASHPNVDLDACLSIIEARVATHGTPPVHVLAYLQKCLAGPGMVRKRGDPIAFDDGSTGYLKTYADEDLWQGSNKR